MEEAAGGIKGMPARSGFGQLSGTRQPFPEGSRKVTVEVFAFFADGNGKTRFQSDVPGEHAGQFPAHMKVQMIHRIEDFSPPKSPGDTGGVPPETVVTLPAGFGGGADDVMIGVRR